MSAQTSLRIDRPDRNGDALIEYEPYDPSGFVQLPLPPAGLATTARPTQLPKRPKGRFFVSMLLLGLCGFAAYQAWNTFYRYQAFGVVDGRRIDIYPPWDGVVRMMHVQEGQRVRQGDILCTVENIDLQHELSKLRDDLSVARAMLESEASRLKWQIGSNTDQHQKAAAAYYEDWGNLLSEEGELRELEIAAERARDLLRRNAVATAEVDKATLAYQARKQQVEKLRSGVVESKKRVELSSGMTANGDDQLKPHLAKITALMAEVSRVEQRVALGEIKAPTSGVVLAKAVFPGEFNPAAMPVLTILEEGSLAVKLYMPQASSDLLEPGSEVNVVVEPNPNPVPLKVERIGEQYLPPPPNIQSYYRKDEKLLLVELKPQHESEQWMLLRVDAVAKLARNRESLFDQGSRWLASWH